MAAPRPPLSRREREIMEVVYRLGSPTAAEIAAALPDPPSYSAVRATIAVLESKGHLRHETRGHRYAYLPTVPAAAARKRALRQMVSTFFQGSSKQAVVALLDDAARELSSADLEEIRRRIDEAKQQGR
jgi:BlaI family transcriptional regulator, penicillinase repressor